jgi:hypothetical protein
VQSIQRLGGWSLTTYQQAYLLTALKPEALLAMGFWPGAAQGELNMYWRETFMVMVPDELIQYLAPWLEPFAQQVQEAEAAGVPVPQSARGFVRLVRYLMFVLVQDAMELAEDYPSNPVFSYLLKNTLFR